MDSTSEGKPTVDGANLSESEEAVVNKKDDQQLPMSKSISAGQEDGTVSRPEHDIRKLKKELSSKRSREECKGGFYRYFEDDQVSFGDIYEIRRPVFGPLTRFETIVRARDKDGRNPLNQISVEAAANEQKRLLDLRIRRRYGERA